MAGGAGTGAAASGTTNQQWRTPSATHQQNYSLQPLPEDVEPTKEEESLLAFYGTIRNYERQAARLKDAAARARLAARDAEFQKMNAERKANKRRRKKKKSAALEVDDEMADDSDQDSSGSNDDSMDDDEEEDEEEDTQKSTYDRREEKLQALREEVEAKISSNPEAEEEELRQELLTRSTSLGEDGPMLKRKKAEPVHQSSLIASLAAAATPPHDFSKKLGLSPLNGRKLFPSTEETDWSPSPEATSPDDGALTLELDSFDVSQANVGLGNNTVAIKFMAPEKSKRFSINIAGPGHDNFHSVLFHFNPRQRERGGQLVLNNKKEGTWGSAINVPLNSIPITFGETSCTLVIQINGEGFDTFLNDRHIARLEHRRELASGNNSLWLNFPATDDYNKPESWTVYKVWWGNKPVMAKGDMADVAGYKSFNSVHPRKLFISKLRKIRTDPEVDLRRAELERAFRKHGGARGVTICVQKYSTFAFIEFETERQSDIALQEMAGHYRIHRARRTRHEALQEERAAAEAAKTGLAKKKVENSDWD